jgi:hypothetical protein
MAFGREIAKRLFPFDQARADAAVSEIDRILADEIETVSAFWDLTKKVKVRRERASTTLDIYFKALADFWRRIGGAKKPPGRKTRALLVSFVQAAAKPVVMDKKSLSREAIAVRLRRIERPRKRQMA